MRKKFLVLALAAIVGASTAPIASISDGAVAEAAAADDAEDFEEAAEDSQEVTKGDIVVSPAKKTIKIGAKFTIDLYPSDDFADANEDLPDEEWEELLGENIDSITFRSSKSSVAYVNSKGVVKGKKKGSAVIKTTVTFRDGSEGTYKTKVYVTR